MLLREFSDTVIILAVILLTTAVGVFQEGKAVKAMEALKKITAPEAPCEKRRGVPEDPGGPSGKGGPGEGRGRRSGAGRYPASQGKGTVRRRICAYGGIPPCAEVLPAFTARSACGGEAEHAFYVFSDHERQRRRDRYPQQEWIQNWGRSLI